MRAKNGEATAAPELNFQNHWSAFQRGAVVRQRVIEPAYLLNLLDNCNVAAVLTDKEFNCIGFTGLAKDYIRECGIFSLRGCRLICDADPPVLRRMLISRSQLSFEIVEQNHLSRWRLHLEQAGPHDDDNLLLLVIQKEQQRRIKITPTWVQSHFSLTPGESELAAALANGATTRSFAQDRGVSIHTVRNQLKSIFSKLDVHSQKDLMLFLTETG